MIKSCQECCKSRRQPAEPLLPSALPQLPWQKVGTDIFEWNKSSYLLIIDYYSRWIKIARLRDMSSEEVVLHTRSIFARHRIPEMVISDNGPQFACDTYAKFAREYGFDHITSSPHYPQCNGEVERTVQTVKSLLWKSGDPFLAILAYRATPLQSGFSPAELLMSRKLRTTVPIVREQRKPKVVEMTVFMEKDNSLKEHQRDNFDSHHRAKELPPLSLGDWVWVPDRESPGQVLKPDGTYQRNRKYLIQLPVPDPEQIVEPQTSDLPETSAESVPTYQTRSKSGRAPKPPERLDPSWT